MAVEKKVSSLKSKDLVTFEENSLERETAPVNDKVGLVLEGGGVKGAYHIGALKALFEMGYVFDGVAGTSIGALNAAMIAQGDFSALCEIWDDVNVSDIMDMDSEFLDKIASSAFTDREFWLSLGKKVWKLDSFFKENTERMHRFVRDHLDPDRLMASPMDFGIVTYSVSERKPYELMKQDIPFDFLDEYIIASATFPVYNFMDIGGKKFMDGGVYDNMPINLLARHGYRNFVAIRTSSKPPKRQLEFDNCKVTYIVPSEDLGLAMMFTKENVQLFQKLGYFDAMRVLKGYGGTKFYFSGKDVSGFSAPFLNMQTGMLVGLVQRVGLPVVEDKDENVKSLVKLIRREMYLPSYVKDGLVLQAFFEEVGKTLEVDKFQVYEVSDFLSNIESLLAPLAYNRASFSEKFRELRSTELIEIVLSIGLNALK